MKIDMVIVGKLGCNCYILDINNKVLVIDPGDETDKIINVIGNRNLLGIIITHYHFDHIGALSKLKDKYNTCVYDISNMEEGENRIGDFIFDVIYTPGHKEDAITIYFKDEKIMFTGDFIFKDSVGRCDLPGGNPMEMLNSLEKIKKYEDVLIYPGHGDNTTLNYEKNNNVYFKYSGMLLID